MGEFPEAFRFEDPDKTAGFLARLGYDTDNIANALAERFGLDEEDARQIAQSAAEDAAQLHEREQADLDRAAIEAEHQLDP